MERGRLWSEENLSPRQDIDLEYYRTLLEKKMETIKKGIKSLKEGTFSLSQKDLTGEMSSYDQHSADLAFSTFERSKDLGLKDGLEVDSAKVRAALERIEKGLYGYCLSCRKPLPVGRLEAMPDAELCVECQKRQEVSPASHRPVEEQVAYNHMGGFEELTDDVVMRGEDLPRPEKPFRYTEAERKVRRR